MKEANSQPCDGDDKEGSDHAATYAHRFQIEESFRDIKNKRWGWKLRFTRLSGSDRYLRMLLIAAVTMAVTLLIGLQGERRGYDMDYKANTEKTRTHSLVWLGAAMLDHRPGCSLRWLEQLLEDPTQLLAA